MRSIPRRSSSDGVPKEFYEKDRDHDGYGGGHAARVF